MTQRINLRLLELVALRHCLRWHQTTVRQAVEDGYQNEKGKDFKSTQVTCCNQQLKNVHKLNEECDQLVNLDTFMPLFDTLSTPAAGSTLDDHWYIQSTGSSDEINETFLVEN